ncbi:hypothetical protein E6P09_05490 [Haloferax mediterranei ATCC 33500]|uniref:Small CPxCG-related zinc finger protein n=1 Tax=Haloferax mediterranei (strain ATCC 33500 / DSM 1411 / JCM 8866 / NBRC 14739 / NCIMB 2177 / R-4) TaxID=523841 RepID=I3R1W0_HALMT|nr:hypothetical protein [Haloferax mediterranei]AFK18220.2 hypothetical protein HFX_0488 [Haloferax mediterranei ATCC 33500]MDX5988308.1 hypothetical protein [Haloferax mediterranei ATCC 33500]QCQ74743.1 hypothetical protein E6P09_05490 [Haloferax mediterranei ATCC 33500]
MTQSPVCIRCGEQYLFSGTYKGNYCQDCHGDWSAGPRTEDAPRVHSQSTRTSPARRRDADEGTEEPEPPYDEE